MSRSALSFSPRRAVRAAAPQFIGNVGWSTFDTSYKDAAEIQIQIQYILVTQVKPEMAPQSETDAAQIVVRGTLSSRER